MKNYSDNVLLLDGTALIYRSFYAFFKTPLRNSKGENVSAIFGVIKTLQHIDKIYRPKYIAFCFDAKGKTKRAEIYPEYKATRQKIPDELLSQIPAIKKLVSLMGFNFIEMEGYEADDIISSIARQNDKKTVIISSDKDIAQLVNKRIYIATPSKPEILLDEKKIYEKYGVFPSQIVDYLALIGDSSDNIPGIPGIGPKTASSLLHDFGSIEGIYKNIGEIKSKRIKENLEKYREQLDLALNLIKLNDHLEVGDIDNYSRGKADIDSILTILQGYELWSLVKEFRAGKEEQLSLFESPLRNEMELKIESDFNPDYPIAKEISLFFSKNFISLANGNSAKLYDITNENKIIYFILTKCNRIITNDAKRIHRFIFSEKLNIQIAIDDISIASSLIFGGKKRVSETNILSELINVVPPLEKKDDRYTLLLLAKNSSDLWGKIDEKLENLSIKKLYEQLELPIAKILALMEYNGILVNVKTLESIRKEFTKKIEAIIDKCRVYTKEINLNSPKQLATILFEKLKLPAIKKTKTGFSTNNETLRKLSKFHPLPSLIIDYREYTKFKTSYLDSFPSFIASDNRIHTTYNQINVDTGRLSSNNPNLQNIPTRSEEGKRLRKIFVASPGYQLVSFDYSQIELRVMAHMSKDKNLTEAFNSGLDIHKQTAALIFGIEEALVSSDMRRKAKVINFGIMYGMSPYGLSKELNISLNEAKQFINNYFKNYMGVKQWIDKTIKFARDNQYVRTLKGRIRYIPTINSKNKNEFEFAKRIAINTPIQGSAAELIKMAMIDIYKKYGNSEDVKMLLQIHDELIFEIRNNFMNEIDVIKNIMESTIHLNVPLVVTVGKGKSWFEASK